MNFFIWIACSIAIGAMYEATTTRKRLQKKINNLEVEIELLKYELNRKE